MGRKRRAGYFDTLVFLEIPAKPKGKKKKKKEENKKEQRIKANRDFKKKKNGRRKTKN